jgi:hypothetical protein
MHSNLVAYAAGLLLILSTGTVFAARGPSTEGQFVKNGFPCFAEVCVGDRLEDLSDLDLRPVNPNGYSGVVPNMARYSADFRRIYGLWDDAFARGPAINFASPELIQAASLFESVCTASFQGQIYYPLTTALEVGGIYESASGHRTTVSLKLLPDPTDPQLRTRFFVTELRRFIEVSDPGERVRVQEALRQRYAQFATASTPKPFQGAWPKPRFLELQNRDQSFPGAPLGVETNLKSGVDVFFSNYMWDKLSSHPRCTTSTTPSLD